MSDATNQNARMNCERIQEYLSKDADGAAADWEREAIAAHVSGCAECAAFAEAIAPVGAALRAATAQAVEAADFSRLWSAVEAGIDAAPSRAALRRPRPAAEVRVSFAQILVSRLAWVGAAAAIGAVALLAHTSSAPTPGMAQVKPVEIESVEAGSDDTVTIDTNDDGATIIWVDEDTGAKS